MAQAVGPSSQKIQAPPGATEPEDGTTLAQIFRPPGARALCVSKPTARAVGYVLAALRAFRVTPILLRDLCVLGVRHSPLSVPPASDFQQTPAIGSDIARCSPDPCGTLTRDPRVVHRAN